MRSSDSRSLRWTVHVTPLEFELLELLREEYGAYGEPFSRAALLMALVDQAVDESLGPDVFKAWQRVQHELRCTDHHTAFGGRPPRVTLRRKRLADA